ncbi:MAG: DUF3662 and FHA domain-containing protein [Actinomycetia bacterium]|nr:DUF3662 and FHA domain-containing protein [Actinomycetes bacterium]
MGLISDFEEHLGGAIEGAFAGMFKSPVQPAELARACSKEMSRSKKLGVGTVYVANVYSVLLSARDHDALAGLIPTLQGELETYLLAFSREHDFQMATRPIVRFYPAPDLKLGRFEAIGDMLSVEEIETELGPVAGVTPEPQDTPAPEPAPAPEADESALIAAPGFAPEESVAIAAPGFRDLDIEPVLAAPGIDDLNIDRAPRVRPTPRLRHNFDLPAITEDDQRATRALTSESASSGAALSSAPVPEIQTFLTMDNFGPLSLQSKQSVGIGRQDDNDLVIADVNASRHHARLEREDGGWILVDLGATNGTLLNNKRVTRARLRDGDVVTIGVTKITYHEKVLRS